jgi:acyl-CoA thioester hydrolase
MNSDDSRLLLSKKQFFPATYDIDFAGHVSNIVYIRWLEDLRLKWLDEFCPLKDLMEDGIAPTLLRTEIDYKRQIKIFDTPVEGEIWISKPHKLKFFLSSRFLVNGNVMAEALQMGVFVKMPNLRPVRIPEQITSLVY